jgi:hypothetical protein
MKSGMLIIMLLLFNLAAFSQKPKNGSYTYKLAYDEWGGKSLGSTVTVIIKGDSIKIVNDGSTSGIKGETIDEGIIMQHKSGKWIIAHDKKDKDAPDIGGCGDGPREIDFKKKIVWTC